jgi:hypothetical protein
MPNLTGLLPLFGDANLYLAYFVWRGRSAAALRYPAPLTVRPLLPVVTFAACGSPCPRVQARPRCTPALFLALRPPTPSVSHCQIR